MTSSDDAATSWRRPEPGDFWIDGPFAHDRSIHLGPLEGVDIAVKDNIAVAGRVTGNGNPTFASSADPAASTAPAVAALLAAGASLRGRVVSDEFAYSLMGVNAHLGTPRNQRWPAAVPGGSSSGCAAAVAAEAAVLGVGTDTGGSIRVPASYCGLVGFRPTHGRIDTTGVTPLSPSFDTVGLLVRGEHVAVLGSAAAALLEPGRAEGGRVREVMVARDLIAIAEPAMKDAVMRAAEAVATALGVTLTVRDLLPVSVDDVRTAFSAMQGFEAWRALGAVVGPLAANVLDLAPDILERFEFASAFSRADATAATRVQLMVRDALDAATANGRLIAQPGAAGAPPARDSTDREFATARLRSLELTAPAGLAGTPVVVLPTSPPNVAPRGVAFIGGRDTDEGLLAAVCATPVIEALSA